MAESSLRIACMLGRGPLAYICPGSAEVVGFNLAGGGRVKRIAAAAIALGLLAIVLVAVSRSQASGKEGELAFLPESMDLGKVPLDVPAPFRFEMRNVGDKPVKIVGNPKITAVEGC